MASPALFTSYPNGRDIFDDEADYQRNDVFDGIDQIGSLPVRIDCGRSDSFYPAVSSFVKKFPTARRPVRGFSTGCHDFRFWNSVAPAQLQFLGAALR